MPIGQKGWCSMAFGKFLREAVLEGIIFSGIVTLAKKLTEKGAEKVEKRIEKAFGLTSEEALKSDKDDIALAKVLAKGILLKPEQKKEVRAWIGNLQETDPALASELTRRIFNILAETTTEDESTVGTGEKAKKKTFKNDADGILIAESLLLEILEASEKERLAVLKRNNIKVDPKKPHPKVEKAKKFAKETAEKGFGAAKKAAGKVAEKATTAGEKVAKDQKANFADLGKFAETANTNAKQRFQDAINKRRMG